MNIRMAIDASKKDLEQLRERVRKAIGSDWDLRTFKGIFLEIMRIIHDPSAGAKDLARIISLDPGLTARTLRVINSPYYALSTKVNDLSQAVVLLGFEMLKQIALSISVFDAFAPGTRGYLIRLWRNGLGVAKVGEMLAREKGRLWGEAYTLGLLHKIGKILLCSLKEQKYFETLSKVKHESISDLEAEKQVLGVDYTEIGYIAAIHWELPPLITEGIYQHRIEFYGTELNHIQFLSQVVTLADEVCSHLGLGISENPVVGKGSQLVKMIPAQHYENLGFDAQSFSDVISRVPDLMNEIEELLHLLQVS